MVRSFSFSEASAKVAGADIKPCFLADTTTNIEDRTHIGGSSAAAAKALQFYPSGNVGGNSQLYVSNSEIRNAGGGLVEIKPSDGTIAKTYFTRVEVHHGGFGVAPMPPTLSSTR